MAELPIIIYTGKDLSPEEDTRLRRFAETIIVKDVKSPERLLDETALFLHRVVADLPVEKQKMLERLHHSDDALVGRKVLVVDDDVRNIFALTSVLEQYDMQIVSADNGHDAIQMLGSGKLADIVLMDIMMPDMDGIATIREIRKTPKGPELPIIAVTAKAMKGDREKCIAAGAWDYLSKPVNTQDLLAALRAWLTG